MSDSLIAGVARGYPAPWILAAALLSGVAIAAGTRRRPADEPEAARSRRWLGVVLCASGALVAWLGAVFVPGPARIAEIKYLTLYLAATTAVSVAVRFPRTAGSAMVALAALYLTLGLVFSRALRPAAEGGEIGRVVVYAAGNGTIDVDVSAPGRASVTARLRGDRLVPLVRRVSFDELWPFLGWRAWYRLEGMTAFSVRRSAEGVVVSWAAEPALFELPAGASEALYAVFEARAAALPGVEVRRLERGVEAALLARPDAAIGRVQGVREYAVRLGGVAGYELVPVGARPGDAGGR